MDTGAITQLEAAIDALAAEPVAGAAHGDALVTLTRLRSQLDAEIARRLDALCHSSDWAADGAQSPAAWIRRRANQSRRDANRQIRLAQTIATLPVTAAAWAAGEITTGHVEIIATTSSTAKAPELFTEYEPVLLDLARVAPPEDLTAVAKQWLTALDDHLDRNTPPGATTGEAFYAITTNGIGVLNATFDSEGAAIVERALARAYEAAHHSGDARTAPHQRADAIIEICRTYLAGLPADGNRPHILFVNDLADYHGYVIGRAETTSGHRIATETIRRTLCNADFSIVDTRDGIPLKLTRTRRLFTKHQYRAMIARDHHCRGPGCDAPPERCEAHHITPWNPEQGDTRGGHTDLDNGILLCRGRCHRGVHEGRWTITGNANGRLTFHDHDGNLIGATNPHTLSPALITRHGQTLAATRQRISELHALHHGEPPSRPNPDTSRAA